MLDFSARGWGRVIAVTLVGTLLCVAAAVYVDSFNFDEMSDERLQRALLIDILLPLVLAAPAFFFFTTKLRELAIAQERLTQLAATDSLTTVLNRGAFTTLVDAWLAEVRAQERDATGALLVVDADNFKSINDRYGHDRGDEALKLIAAAIRDALRSPDIVGRIGGEEFGVFLPQITPGQAVAVAERIRRSVSEAPFTPDGTVRPMSVSVGGAVFDRRIAFTDLFRLADQQLYAAKRNGKNQVCVTPIDHYDSLPAAAA